jgi:hypothetical protein
MTWHSPRDPSDAGAGGFLTGQPALNGRGLVGLGIHDGLGGGVRHTLATASRRLVGRFRVNDLAAAQTVEQDAIVSFHDSSP